MPTTPAHQDELDEHFARALDLDDADEHESSRTFDDRDYQDGDDDAEDEQGDDQEEYDEDGRRAYLNRSPSNASSAGSNSSSMRPYAESAEITSKKYLERDQVKLAMEQEERAKRLHKIRTRRQQIEKWEHKTARSPFQVNLVADSERLDEEHRLRMLENARRSRELERRTRDAKTEVILKALTESSDLELLRREKRAIIDEEKRLKALLDLEKTNSHRKLDLMAARNAEKKRRAEREDHRRRARQLELENRDRQYKVLLKEKLALES